MQIIETDDAKSLEELMRGIKVDPYGIKIMLPKGISHLVRINSVSNITANILKQEMLSFGGDVAVARDALTGKSKKTDCLLMGNLSQIERLKKKLGLQPFGLDRIGRELTQSLANYHKNNFSIELGRYKLNPGKNTLIMGILNLTPDSFSQDGIYSEKKDPEIALDYAQKLVNDGADIIDVGGESSRPGAKPIPLKEELARTIPVIKLLAKKIKVPISIDTYKPEVASEALAYGVSLVNDITGLTNRKMLRLVSAHRCGIIIMHMRGNPRSMQKNPLYKSLIEEITEFLSQSVQKAIGSGVSKNRIIIDPGIGFGKTADNNLEILKNLKRFKILGQPILVGPSRKSFIGKILKTGPKERLFGTISSCMLAVGGQAKILRVHDVKEVKEALKITEAVNRA